MTDKPDNTELAPMDEAAISQYIIDTFAGSHPVTAWGDTFFYYNPERKLPDEFYFATLKTQDDDYDRASNLNRPSVFRLNIGLSRETYRSLFGPPPSGLGAGGFVDTGHDFTVLDQLLPHPVYASAAWVCVLNPGPATFQAVQPLLAEAYDLAVNKYARRLARG